MKKLSQTLIGISLLLSIAIIFNFFYLLFKGYSNYNKISNNIEKFGIIGDFISGHLNGIVLITLIISLYFQRISIEKQEEANQTIKKELTKTVEANTLQTKEFMTMKYTSEFQHELKYIEKLEKEIKIQNIYKANFEKFHIVDNHKLIEIFKRKDYLIDLLNSLDDHELKKSLQHKLETSTFNKYDETNQSKWNRVFVFNEIIKIFDKYIEYRNKRIQNGKLPEYNKLIYEFLIHLSSNNSFKDDTNQFELFEEISLANSNLFKTDHINSTIYLYKQKLWEIILFETYEWKIEKSFKIAMMNYKLRL